MVLGAVMAGPKLATAPRELGFGPGAPALLVHLLASPNAPPPAAFHAYWRFLRGVTPAQVVSTRSSSMRHGELAALARRTKLAMDGFRSGDAPPPTASCRSA